MCMRMRIDVDTRIHAPTPTETHTCRRAHAHGHKQALATPALQEFSFRSLDTHCSSWISLSFVRMLREHALQHFEDDLCTRVTGLSRSPGERAVRQGARFSAR